MYSVQCSLYNLVPSPFLVLSSSLAFIVSLGYANRLLTSECIVDTIQLTVYRIQRTVSNLTVYNVKYLVYSIYHIVYSVQYTVNNILCTVQSV